MPVENLAIAEPPKETPPPAPPAEEPKVKPQHPKSTFGEKYREQFAKLEQKAESPTAHTPDVVPDPSPPVSEKPAEVPKTPTQKEPVPASKPSSPLEAAIGDTKLEPKAETPKDDLPEKLDGASDKANDNWGKARGKISKLEARIKELESAPPPKQEDNGYAALQEKYQTLETRYNDQENRLKSINAEYSDEYRGLLSERDGIVTKIGKRVEAFGGDKNSLVSALQLPDGKVKTAQIKEALSEMDSDDKARIHTLIENLDAHDEKIDAFKSDLPAQFDRMVADRQQQEQQFVAENIKALETEFGKISVDIPKSSVTLRMVPSDIDGAEDWNASIKSATERALSVLKPNNEPFSKTVEIAIKGSNYDNLEKMYLQLHKDYTELKAQRKEEDAASPDFKGTPKPKPSGKTTAGAAKFHEAMRQLQAAQDD